MPKGDLILVVEDEPNLREPLAHLLRLRHFDVITADTVDGALAGCSARITRTRRSSTFS